VALWLAARWLLPGGLPVAAVTAALFLLAPLPPLLAGSKRRAELQRDLEAARAQEAQAHQLCEAMRYRVKRLREDLMAADSQARTAHQLTLLGQFVAGFLHEVNNPLAILTGRVEVLLQERATDVELCSDLERILNEARYIEKISGTLLPALRRAQVDSAFEPALPAEAIERALASLRPLAESQGSGLRFERVEAPRVNLPSHIIEEVVRALVSNALQVLEKHGGGTVRVRLKPSHPARPTVLFEVEDDGPGVPQELRDHLFEPFVSRSTDRRRSGLGLFIVASLLQIYDGAVRYEAGGEAGARFLVEMPRARFTKEQPYHWFASRFPEEEREEQAP
jgi:two-component system C4-dicarboxylate transport sensor histidine kinase DctB